MRPNASGTNAADTRPRPQPPPNPHTHIRFRFVRRDCELLSDVAASHDHANDTGDIHAFACRPLAFYRLLSVVPCVVMWVGVCMWGGGGRGR